MRRLVFSRACCSSFSEAFGQLGFGDLRCDDLEEVPPEAAQLAGPELLAVGDHLRLCFADQSGIQVGGERFQGVHHDLGLCDRHVPVGHPGGDRVHLQSTRVGEAGLGPGGRDIGTSQVSQPRTHIPRAGLVGGITRCGQDAELQLRGPRLEPGDLDDRLPLLTGGHEQRLHLAHPG